MVFKKVQLKINSKFDFDCCYAIEYPPAEITTYRTIFYEKILEALEKEIYEKMKRVFPKITRHLIPLILDLDAYEKLPVLEETKSQFNELYRKHEREKLESDVFASSQPESTSPVVRQAETSIRWDRLIHLTP